jgi:hypothetical protein
MQITIDAREFFNHICKLEKEELGTYVLSAAIDMINSNTANYPWITEAPEKKTRKKKERKSYNDGYTPEFEIFWINYPKKIGKGAAFDSWQKIRMDKGQLLSLCMTAIGWQKFSEQWSKDNGQYIPNPQTYLNQRRWEDEAPMLITKKASLGDLI